MKIQIYHATAGHGHKKVADVIGQTFNRRGVNDVQVIDLLDLTHLAV